MLFRSNSRADVTVTTLFPASAYDCFYGTNELRWDGSSKLFVNGVFYFDGGLSLSTSKSVYYSGSGSLSMLTRLAASSAVATAACTGTDRPGPAGRAAQPASRGTTKSASAVGPGPSGLVRVASTKHLRPSRRCTRARSSSGIPTGTGAR